MLYKGTLHTLLSTINLWGTLEIYNLYQPTTGAIDWSSNITGVAVLKHKEISFSSATPKSWAWSEELLVQLKTQSRSIFVFLKFNRCAGIGYKYTSACLVHIDHTQCIPPIYTYIIMKASSYFADLSCPTCQTFLKKMLCRWHTYMFLQITSLSACILAPWLSASMRFLASMPSLGYLQMTSLSICILAQCIDVVSRQNVVAGVAS